MFSFVDLVSCRWKPVGWTCRPSLLEPSEISHPHQACWCSPALRHCPNSLHLRSSEVESLADCLSPRATTSSVGWSGKLELILLLLTLHALVVPYACSRRYNKVSALPTRWSRAGRVAFDVNLEFLLERKLTEVSESLACKHKNSHQDQEFIQLLSQTKSYKPNDCYSTWLVLW